MSASKNGLSSIAAYTDSEDDSDYEPQQGESASNSPIITVQQHAAPTIPNPGISRLVSYPGEDVIDDEEPEESPKKRKREDSESDCWSPEKKVPTRMSPADFLDSLANKKIEDIELPPKPEGRCSQISQDSFCKLVEKLKRNPSKPFSKTVLERKDFRNPSIYDKLILFCNIEESGTNFHPDVFNPTGFKPESFYTELSKRQKEDIDRIEKEKKERTKVEFLSGTKKADPIPVTGLGEVRKSKWDAQPSALNTRVLPAASGTKPTVISAIGQIAKLK